MDRYETHRLAQFAASALALDEDGLRRRALRPQRSVARWLVEHAEQLGWREPVPVDGDAFDMPIDGLDRKNWEGLRPAAAKAPAPRASGPLAFALRAASKPWRPCSTDRRRTSRSACARAPRCACSASSRTAAATTSRPRLVLRVARMSAAGDDALLAALLGPLLPSLTDSAFKAGKLASLEVDENGAHEMPYAVHSRDADVFWEVACTEGWVMHGHDWSAEVGNEGFHLHEAPAVLEQATADQLRLVISYIIHRE